MNKKKIRLNILDLVIVVALICTVAAIVFRTEILEIFGEPVIAPVELTLSASDVDAETARGFKSGDEVSVVLAEGEEPLVAVITGVRITAHEDGENARLELTLTLDGYRRIGVFYTAGGVKLKYDDSVTVLFLEGSQAFTVSGVKLAEAAEETA